MAQKRKTQWQEELLSELHPTKNGKLNPRKGSCGNQKLLWWLCVHGHSWQASIFTRQRGQNCPKCSTVNTSLPEQLVFEYIRSVFSDAENRADVRVKGKRFECDVFIPSLRFAIEYDGPHHVKKVRTDLEKNQYLHIGGIQLVRIRDPHLPQLEPFGSIVICDRGSSVDGLTLMAGELRDALVQTRDIPQKECLKLQTSIDRMPETVEGALIRFVREPSE